MNASVQIRILAVVLCFFILSSAPLNAFAGSINDLDPKQICPREGQAFSKYAFARAIITQYSIPVDILDWNDSGIGYDEYAQALAVFRCAQAQSVRDKNKC